MMTPDKVYLRDYSKIYTGTNQEGGYENPFLGFTSDTVELVFKPDKSTYFHYPYTAEIIPISATDLIESGAFAASIPYKADKIFKKQANYSNHTPWGNSLPINQQKGVWLCTWLSGNDVDPTQKPKWMDRWYNPGILDSSHAFYEYASSAVYDIESILTFDPGSWYRYDHIGTNANLQIVDNLNGLVIRLDNWNEATTDESGSGNNATLNDYSDNMIGQSVNITEYPDDTSLRLNGSRQYASILYSNTFDVSGTITCNAWVKSDNWKHPQNQHIISNGLRGGWNIGINTGFFTPFTVICDVSGNIVFLNQDGRVYKDIKLPGTPAPVGICVDSELYTWILDDGVYENKKHLYKIDFNGNVVKGIEFAITDTLNDVLVSNDKVHVLLNSVNLYSYDLYGNYLTTAIVSGTKIIVDKDDNVISFNNAVDACILDDSSSYWHIDLSGNIYKNNTLFLSGLSATNIQCPRGTDLYVLYGYDKIMKIDGTVDQLVGELTFSVELTAQIPDSVSLNIPGRNIFFTNEYTDSEYKDYVWVTQPNSNYVYKYDTQLQLIKKTNITYVENSVVGSAIRGDSTGYNWYRLFNYPTLIDGIPQVEGVVYLGTGTPTLTGQKFKTAMPVSGLSEDGWHMFTFIIDTEQHQLRLYTDTILRDTASIPVSSNIYYKYETPLSIGTNIGKIVPLDEELGKIDRFYFNGNIDDLRLYANVLNNSDIRHIYLTKYEFRDLIWNMPTGLQSYIEEIVRFFKFKLPGQKSQSYNIRLVGLQITDINTRAIIEEIIRDTIKKVAPLYTTLYKIVWE